MRISDASHHLKKTSLWDYGNQADADDVLTTAVILNKATATIRASLGVNTPQTIWGSLGRHLEKQLMQLKAVNVTNFGAFGLDRNNGLVFVQDPVFLHMTRLCLASRKRGNLVAPALGPSQHIEDVDVEGLAAAYLQNCSKDLAKAVISSVLAWVTTWAKDGQQMRLSFLPVGEWICDGESVDFRFSEAFRKEAALTKAAKEEQEAEIPGVAMDGDNLNNNQLEDQEPLGDQIACPPHAARSSVESEKPDADHAKGNLAVDTSSSAAKAAATQSASPAGRSRYKLRAPTFSSTAKQLPPHGQRRKKRTDLSVEMVPSNSKAKTASKKKPGTVGRGVPRAVNQVGSVSPKLDSTEFDSETEEILAAINKIRPGTASACSARPCKSAPRSKPAPGPSPQQLDTVNRLLKRISNRKGHSMQGLNALVAVLRPFKTGAISSTELSLSLRKLGVKVSSGELKDIAAAFSHEKRGYIDISRFMDTLRGPPLSGTRLDLVAKVFYRMDPTCSGVVNVDEMIKHYDVGFLPQVREGKQSKLEALSAFLQEWAPVCSSTGNTITFEAFVRYYQNVGVCISNDADFERLMHQAWRLPEEGQDAENEPPSRTNSKNVSTHSSPGGASSAQPAGAPETFNAVETADSDKETHPGKAWAYLRALLLFPQRYQTGVSSWPTLDNMCRRLGANRVLGDGNEIMNIKAFAHSLAALDKRLSHKDAYDLSCFVADHCAPSLDDSDTIVLSSLYRLLTTSWNEKAASDAVDYNYVEYYASRAIERLRARVNGSQIGSWHAGRLPSVDLNTLEKWLDSSCSNGESLLMKYELRSALMKVGLDISYQDLDYLFAYFDADHQGYINYQTFLEALRSPSNMLPKLARPQAKPLTRSEEKPVDESPFQQPSSLMYNAAPQPTVRRRKQAAAREPQPDFRRRNLIHRAIWDQTRKKEMSDTRDKFDKLEMERHRRYRAAQIIQTKFRAFRARQTAVQLRRKAAARSYRSNTLAQEHQQLLTKKMKANRTALPTAYGF